jgi:glutaminase
LPGATESAKLFRSMATDGCDLAPSRVVLATLEQRGLLRDDPRIADAIRLLSSSDEISYEQFHSMKSDNCLIERALLGALAVREWRPFCASIEQIMEEARGDVSGAVAGYIPQLARVDPEQWGVGVCSVDGQRMASGDACVPFCVQSCTKPLAYAMALEHFGPEKVHRHVGREPSGRNFNERCLNKENLPHNPLINAGAIMTASLVRPDLALPERWDYIVSIWTRLTGGRRPGFANSVYLSESASADRNWCLAYMMQEAGSFPAGTNLQETLEFYFMLCSIEVDASAMAAVAATLANSGVCPLTGDRVFSDATVRHTLSLMASCGMYDYSGEFAFLNGFPCKSGVGGSLLIVVPGVAGFCTWSPRLDRLGNSARGIDFCRRLSARFPYHMLESEQYLGGSDPSGAAGSEAGAPAVDRTGGFGQVCTPILSGPSLNTGWCVCLRYGSWCAQDSIGESAEMVELWNAAASGDLLRLRQVRKPPSWPRSRATFSIL